MPPDTRIRPAGNRADQEATGLEASTSLRDQARRLILEAQDCHPDLAAWAQGYVQGYDAAVAGEVRARLLELAEHIAEHDHRSWIPLGAFSRQRRIAREIAEMAERAVPVRDSPDWPKVARPREGSA